MRPARFDAAAFNTGAFLRDSWHKAPLLIRNAWTDWQNPLAPDELAGLACEAGTPSRLIRRDRGRATGRLICEHGPFAAARFDRLGKQNWTLLVQAVDHHVPPVAALIEAFGFLPNWRIDDVMVSYAVDGGGVGAHFDRYDVFLIQGLGRRRWRIGQHCTADTAMVPHDDLRLVAEFTPIAEYLLEPGDMLYIPPGIAHDGAAVGDACMTYSVGFRAPARSELISNWADHLLAALPQDDRYADPDLPIQANPGEITQLALAALHALVADTLRDPAGFARWFGSFATAPKYPDTDWAPATPIAAADVARRFARTALLRNPASRFSFIRRADGGIWLFVDGTCFDCTDVSVDFAERLCARPLLMVGPAVLASAPARAMIVQLFNQGSVSFDPS